MNQIDKHGSHYGVIYGISAYGLWGIFPLYFKVVSNVAPLQVLAHRALWSFLMLAILAAALGRWKELWQAMRNRKLLFMLALSSLFIAANWLTFIYAVGSRQVVQASLGYFINPLVNVLLGVLFLGERLRTRQTLSIGLALIGVVVLTAFVGEVPWIALTLALTFSFYALMRKLMPLDGFVSLAVETLVMAPLCLGYLVFIAAGSSGPPRLSTLGLLILSGPITTVPLLFFGAAARRLRLSTMGIIQYLTPTLQFLLAVVAFGEPLSLAKLLSFVCIWAAVLIYAFDSLNAARSYPVAVIEPD